MIHDGEKYCYRLTKDTPGKHRTITKAVLFSMELLELSTEALFNGII